MNEHGSIALWRKKRNQTFQKFLQVNNYVLLICDWKMLVCKWCKTTKILTEYKFWKHFTKFYWELFWKTSQELQMLSSVTINCHVRMIVWMQVLNCQNCNQCLKCQVSSTVFQIVKNEGEKWGSKMRVKNEGQKWGTKICLIKCLKGHKSLGSLRFLSSKIIETTPTISRFKNISL